MRKPLFAVLCVLFALFVATVAAQTTNTFANVVITSSLSAPSPQFTGSGSRITGAAPRLAFVESDMPADNQKWPIQIEGGCFALQVLNDAESAGGSFFSACRSNATLTSLTLGNPTIGPVTEEFLATSASSTTGGLNFANGTARITSITGNNDLTLDAGGGSAEMEIVSGTVQVTGFLGVSRSSVTPFQVNRTTNDGTLVSLMQDGVEEGNISVSGTTVSYNAFQGSHLTQTEDGQPEPEPGTVVVSTGRLIPSHVVGAEKFVYVEPSTQRNQRGVYGVWFASLGTTAKGMSWGDPKKPVFQVAGLGLTPGVWVTDTCGSYIPKGSLIGTSPLAGLAERQCTVTAGRKTYDPLVRDTTLGKVLTSIDFSTVKPDAHGVRKVLVPAVLYAG